MLGDDPPYLIVGTEVSAKYKGAFCEAKVRKVVRTVKCKVTFKLGLGSGIVTDDQIRGTLRVGQTVEVKHPEKKEFVEAVINKIQDCSQYTVVFDDGDITTLRRTALCLKSGRHFAESETLDQLPLTHPEHFSNPVVGGRRGRRSRQIQDDSSDEEEMLKKGKKKEEKEVDIGKVVCVELGDKKKQKDNWFPGLVVAPTAQDTVRIRVKDEYLVRSFKDGRYYTVPKKEATEFTREIGEKVDNNTLKTAVEKALLFLDKDDLPPHWDRELLFGLDESCDNSDSDGGGSSDSSDDEPREEKDHFVAQLYKFMDDRGTPINKGPTIGGKDVDLYKLFKVVHKMGGYNRVTNHNQWKIISHKVGFGQHIATNLVKQAYKKFLHSFEDFYRKLGCTMVNHPRGSRSRHRSGRSLIRDRDRATPINTPKQEKEKEKEKEKPGIPKRFDKKDEKTDKETAEKEEEKRKDDKSKVKEDKTPVVEEKKDDKANVKDEKKDNQSKVKEETQVTKEPKKELKTKSKDEKIIDDTPKMKEEKRMKKGKLKDLKASVQEEKKEVMTKVKEEKKIEKPKPKEEKKDSKPKIEKVKTREEKRNEKAKIKEEPEEDKILTRAGEAKEEKLKAKDDKSDEKSKVKDDKKEEMEMEKKEDKIKDVKSEKCTVFSKEMKVKEEKKETKGKPKEEKEDKTRIKDEKSTEKVKMKEEKAEEPKKEEKKKIEKKVEEEEKVTRSKSKEDLRLKKDPPPPEKRLGECKIVKECEKKIPFKFKRLDDEQQSLMMKKRGRKRKDTDEKPVGSEENLGQLPNYIQVGVGDKLKVYYGPTQESKVTYEAKVIEIEEDGSQVNFLVHYTGWNTRYDEWIKRGRIAENLSWTPARAKRLRQHSQQMTSRPLFSKRGRLSSTSRSQDLNQSPRSATPSSMTSSSSQSKSPASSTRFQGRITRSGMESLYGGLVFRRRTRRISGLTDIASESDSEVYESDNENEDLCMKTSKERRFSISEKGYESPDVMRIKEEPVDVEEFEQDKSKGDSEDDSFKLGHSSSGDERRFIEYQSEKENSQDVKVEIEEDLEEKIKQEVEKREVRHDNSEAVSVRKKLCRRKASSQQEKESTLNKHRLSSPLRGTNDSSRSEDTLSDNSMAERRKGKRNRRTFKNDNEEEVGSRKHDDVHEEEQPKGRDFDLNQIRSELKGIEKAVKLPLDVGHGSIASETSSEDAKLTPSKSTKQTVTEKLAEPEMEDVYEFKEPEPFEFEVRPKRDVLSSDDRGSKSGRRTIGRIYDEFPHYSIDKIDRRRFKRDGKAMASKEAKDTDANTPKDNVSTVDSERCEEAEMKISSPLRTREPEVPSTSRKKESLPLNEPVSSKVPQFIPLPVAAPKPNSPSVTAKPTSSVKSPSPVCTFDMEPLCLFQDLPEEVEGRREDEKPAFLESEPEAPVVSFSHRQDEIIQSLVSSASPSMTTLSSKPSDSSCLISSNLTSSFFTFSSSKKELKEEMKVPAPGASEVAGREDKLCHHEDVIKLLLKDDDDDEDEDAINAAIQRVIAQPMTDDEYDGGDEDFGNKIDEKCEPIQKNICDQREKMLSGLVVEDSKVDEVTNRSFSKEFEEDMGSDSDSSQDRRLVIDNVDDDSVPEGSDNDSDMQLRLSDKDEYNEKAERRHFADSKLVSSDRNEKNSSKTEKKMQSPNERHFEGDLAVINQSELPVIVKEIEGIKSSQCRSSEDSATLAESEQGNSTKNKDSAPQKNQEEEEAAESSIRLLLCEETIPGSPVMPSESQVYDSENPKMLEMPFVSVPGSNSSDVQASNVPYVTVPSPANSKKETNEAAPVMDNTPPTTPESSFSSESPRGEQGGSSPALDNDSSKSHQDSSEIDLDSLVEGNKVDHFSEDSLLNIEVGGEPKHQGLKISSKKSSLGPDKECESPSKKRRRSRKRSGEGSIKRSRHSSGRTPGRNTGGSDSDDTSEYSATGCTTLTSTENILSSHSPRPSKYNFYVELDPELDGTQRIALLQQKLQELRKTYISVKAELACIDRRRKKLRRREREGESDQIHLVT